MQRGVINNREKAKQLRDFSGLKFGKITPTDIDAIIEYRNKGYIIMEAKTGAAQMPYGQGLALERLCDDLQKSKPTVLIIARHDTPNEKDVDFANCAVDKYRYKGAWHTMKATVKELIEKFIQKLDTVTV